MVEPTPDPSPSIRGATAADEPAVVAALATAFSHDPVWGWAVPQPDVQPEFWRFWVRNGLALDVIHVIEDAKAISIWVVPGVVELDDEGEAAFVQLSTDLLGAGASRVADTMACLESVHPDEPHHYLSLLATHDDHRGRGLGMALLRDDLRRIDARGEPAYLESTNPANLARDASVGFRPRDEITIPGGGQVVTTMWREPQP